MQRQPVYLSSALRDMGKSMGETMARSNKPPTARPNDLGGGGQPNYNPARTNDIGYGRTQKSVSGATGMSVNEAAEAAAAVAAAAATPTIAPDRGGGKDRDRNDDRGGGKDRGGNSGGPAGSSNHGGNW